MQGIGHVVLAERGLIQPGMFLCGGDSHSSNGGAFGCYMAGFGAIEMTGVVVTGEIWMQVPDTIRVNWSGKFAPGVAAKDIMLLLCRELGINNAFRVIEYGGDTVAAMSMNERVVLTNMAAELGAETGIIEPDDVTLDAIRAGGGRARDRRAGLAQRCRRRLPGRARLRRGGPRTAGRGAAFAGKFRSGRRLCRHADRPGVYRRLRRREADGPAHGGRDPERPESRVRARGCSSRRRRKKSLSTRRPTARCETLTEAGAYLLPTGCGACAALGAGILAENEVCISSTNRNFKGRMGANSAEVYLGSPYSVAAAAVDRPDYGSAGICLGNARESCWKFRLGAQPE